jgi:hypothetical protein
MRFMDLLLSDRLERSAAGVHDPSVTIPAVALLIDIHDRLCMAAHAILLQDLFAVFRDGNPLRHLA